MLNLLLRVKRCSTATIYITWSCCIDGGGQISVGIVDEEVRILDLTMYMGNVFCWFLPSRLHRNMKEIIQEILVVRNIVIHTIGLVFCIDFIFVNWHVYENEIQTKFLHYAILYACVLYYMKNKSKRKFKIWNIELSKIFLPTVFWFHRQ